MNIDSIDKLSKTFFALGMVSLVTIALYAAIYAPPNPATYKFKPDEYRVVYIDGKGYMPEVKIDMVTVDVWYAIRNDGRLVYTHDSLDFMKDNHIFHETKEGALKVFSLRNSALEPSIVWSSDDNGELTE